MNSMRLVVLLVGIFLVTGCVSERIGKSGLIQEKITPIGALVGADSSVALHFRSSYFRKTFWSQEEVAQPRFPSRDRYLLMNKQWLGSCCEQTIAIDKQSRAAKARTSGSTTQTVTRAPLVYSEKQIGLEYDDPVIPEKFLAPSALQSDLPHDVFANAVEIPIDQPIVYKYLDQTIFIKFDEVKITSYRDTAGRWAFVAFPLELVDYPIEECLGSVVKVAVFPLAICGFTLEAFKESPKDGS